MAGTDAGAGSEADAGFCNSVTGVLVDSEGFVSELLPDPPPNKAPKPRPNAGFAMDPAWTPPNKMSMNLNPPCTRFEVRVPAV